MRGAAWAANTAGNRSDIALLWGYAHGRGHQSIAHEINQPLCTIPNAEAGQMLLAQSGDHSPPCGSSPTPRAIDARASGRSLKTCCAGVKCGARLDVTTETANALRHVAPSARCACASSRTSRAGSAVSGDASADPACRHQPRLNAIDGGIGAGGRRLVACRSAKDGGVQLRVSDTGRHPAGQRDASSKPSSTKPEGMGLGLSIVHHRRGARRGSAWSLPRRNRTVFSTWLPRRVGQLA